MLAKVIEVLKKTVDVPVHPYGTNIVEECVCYTWSPVSNDGAVENNRLELRLITRTVAKAEQLRKSILSALVTVGDEPKNGYNSCYLNGGGSLWDDNIKMTHTILYLYITNKSEVNYYGKH